MNKSIALSISMLTVLHAQGMSEQNLFESATLWEKRESGQETKHLALIIYGEDKKKRLAQDSQFVEWIETIHPEREQYINVLLDLPQPESSTGGYAEDHHLARLRSNRELRIVEYDPPDETLTLPTRCLRYFSGKKQSLQRLHLESLKSLYQKRFHQVSVGEYLDCLKTAKAQIPVSFQESLSFDKARGLVNGAQGEERLSDVMITLFYRYGTARYRWMFSMEAQMRIINCYIKLKGITRQKGPAVVYIGKEYQFIEKELSYSQQYSQITPAGLDAIRASMSRPLCAACKKEATNRCARCQTTFYCSKECQHDAWPIHKKTCMKGTPY